MLRAEQLLLKYSDSFSLSANWAIGQGDLVAIIGPSGAGKSSLLSAIAGFIPLTTGRIMWHDHDIATLPPAKRPLSILFQEHNLFPHLNIKKNIALGISPDLRLSRQDDSAINEVLKKTEITGLEMRLPHQISGGQMARCALARALLRKKPLLLLDEPFASLGPALRHEMLNLVKNTAQESGTSVLMVSHNPDDAKNFSSSVILVQDGIALPPQPTAELFANPPQALQEYWGVNTGVF